MNSLVRVVCVLLVAVAAIATLSCVSTQMSGSPDPSPTPIVEAVEAPEPAPEPAPKPEPAPGPEPESTSEGLPSTRSATMLGDIAWSTTLESFDLVPDIGRRLSVTLPPGGERNSLWGSYIYSSDSSIGTAAVHMGLVSFAAGGTVVIEIAEGQDYYIGSNMNGVSSSSYSAWNLSFAFVQDGRVIQGPAYQPITWDMNSTLLPDGVDIRLELPPGGEEYAAWGTDTYTSDSSIGTAAVHAGLVTFAGGGRVTIRKIGPQDSFGGSTRNGVTTSAYGAWDQSFVFVRR